MKPLKRAEQKNVIVNKDFYTGYELRKMLERKEVVILGSNLEELTANEIHHISDSALTYDKSIVVRLFLENVQDLKVVCESGHYTTVAIVNDKRIYIEL